MGSYIAAMDKELAIFSAKEIGFGAMSSPERVLQVLIKATTLNMGIIGAMILLYWVWLFCFCLWNCKKYLFSSWFVWACFGTGTIFCFTACTGFVAAASMNVLLVTCYLFFMFMLIMIETIFTANVLLNKNWKDNFPKDKTYRFDAFVDFVAANRFFFTMLGWSFLVAQVSSFALALVLRMSTRSNNSITTLFVF